MKEKEKDLYLSEISERKEDGDKRETKVKRKENSHIEDSLKEKTTQPPSPPLEGTRVTSFSHYRFTLTLGPRLKLN